MHYERAAPLLEANGLRGTFFLKIAGDPIQHPDKWRELAGRGHELGNHTLFHPCRRTRARHSWLNGSFDLRDYTPFRLQQELRVANGFLQLLDGARERTYAYTCFDPFIGRRWNRKPISNLIRSDFVAARGERSETPTAISLSLDLFNIGACQADGRTLEEICGKIRSARDQSAWLTYVIHGIDAGTHPSFIEADVHAKLMAWLSGQPEIWVAPFIDVARRVRNWQMETTNRFRLTDATP